jgi:hypothetical protein
MASAGDLAILGNSLRKAVEEQIAPNEQVLFCLKSKRKVMVVLSNRLLVVSAGPFHAVTEAISSDFRDITGIQVEKGLFEAQIVIIASNYRRSIVVTRGELKEFEPYLARLRVLIHKSKAGVGAPSNSTDADEVISKLERLATLHQTGALTDEEFKVAKAKLLGL